MPSTIEGKTPERSQDVINDRVVGSGQGGNHLSILGNAYFDVIPASAAHFMLVQENEIFPAAMATVLYASVLLENVSTP